MAVKAIDELKAEISAIDNSVTWTREHGLQKKHRRKRLVKEIGEVQERAKLTYCLDETFGRYWKAYQDKRPDAVATQLRVLLPDGTIETPYDWLINELRIMLIRAIRRIRGVRSGRTN